MTWKIAATQMAVAAALLATTACAGRLDSEDCGLSEGEYYPSFFELSGNCGGWTENEKLHVEHGTTQINKLGMPYATIELQQQGCEVFITLTKAKETDKFTGTFNPVGGGEFLVGKVMRMAMNGTAPCTSQYYVVLTKAARVESLLQRAVDTSGP